MLDPMHLVGILHKVSNVPCLKEKPTVNEYNNFIGHQAHDLHPDDSVIAGLIETDIVLTMIDIYYIHATIWSLYYKTTNMH